MRGDKEKEEGEDHQASLFHDGRNYRLLLLKPSCFLFVSSLSLSSFFLPSLLSQKGGEEKKEKDGKEGEKESGASFSCSFPNLFFSYILSWISPPSLSIFLFLISRGGKKGRGGAEKGRKGGGGGREKGEEN